MGAQAHCLKTGAADSGIRTMSGIVNKLLLVVAVVAIVGVNWFFWHRYSFVRGQRANMRDGTCRLNGASYIQGFKTAWSFPIVGPTWSNVPCTVSLEVCDDAG